MITDLPVSGDDHGARTAAPLSMIVAVIMLFFVWGGLTSLNDILVPKLKGLFQLSFTEAMLTQFAFFMAYFIMSLPAGRLVSRWGYVNGIVMGLGIMAVGCLLFVPAASSGQYSAFLAALFVLASGITVLQVAANPLIASLGSVATSHSRLTLAQGFNALGTTIFPPLGAAIILEGLGEVKNGPLPAGHGGLSIAQEAAVVGHAYLAIALILAVCAAFFWMQRRRIDIGTRQGSSSLATGGSLALLKHRRLGAGVVALFLYVGAEVAIGSLLVNYLSQSSVMNLSAATAGKMLALYWGGAMIGRFVGVGALRIFSPGKVLCFVGVGAAALALCSAASSGAVAGWLLLSVGLMNAIMFPTIFGLALEKVGAKAPQASGLLCMAIVGGAIIPLAVGGLADATSLATALILPALCYLYIAAYGWRSARRGSVALDGNCEFRDAENPV